MNDFDYTSQFENYFLNDQFKTSADDDFRARYEVSMPEINHWINRLGILNIYGITPLEFKRKLFYYLKKNEWKPYRIKGRWSKTIFK